ncbi:MAG: LysM domain-containing protein [Pseudanabaena sp. ELA607]|jgi:LysM repeat protein
MQEYIVQSGDTLSSIARRFFGANADWRVIANANGITDPNSLFVGQKLRIPRASSPAPAAAPSSYVVQPGDTLSAIARRFLGPNGDWRVIANANGITDPGALAVGQKLIIPTGGSSGSTSSANAGVASLGNQVGTVLNTLQASYPAGTVNVSFVTVGSDIMAQVANSAAQEFVGTISGSGLYRLGKFRPADVLGVPSDFWQKLSLSDSEVRVISAVAANEGNFDAINTWDNQYLSFGIFQWTAGSADAAGELPALLNLMKRYYPTEFQHYFGRFGLNASSDDGITGWMSLNNKRLSSATDKSQLRQPIWSLRFALAGMDTAVQSVQVLHAINRLEQFYFRTWSSLGGLAPSQILTSEQGVAIMLDLDVNRPAYTVACLKEALSTVGISAGQAAQGNYEGALIRAYANIRTNYGNFPMTHGAERAARITEMVQNGRLSNQRSSFASNRRQRN